MKGISIILSVFFIIHNSLAVEDADEELICPVGITRIAATPLSSDYYECSGRTGLKPILKTCSKRELYLADEQVCESESKHKRKRRDVVIQEEMLLGRDVNLGDFYNAKDNSFYKGINLWGYGKVEQVKYRTNIPQTKTDFYAAKTAFSRLSHMDINAEIKLSFLGGLISVTGSAGFLRDSAQSEEQVNFNMAYQAQTHAWTIPTGTPIVNRVLCDNDATHVVSSVIHGMGANFIFKRHVQNKETAEKVYGFLKVMVKSIPSTEINGQGEVDLSGTQKKFFESVDIKLYGDFVLDKAPTTFAESVKTYQNLPKKLGTYPEYANAGKIKVVLTPKSFYCEKKDNILIGISKQLLSRVSEALDEMEQLQIKIAGLLIRDPTKFESVKSNLKRVRKAVIDFHSNFQLDLKRLLPQVRGGGAAESGMANLLTRYDKSPIQIGTCSIFLTNRAREINAIDTVLEQFTGADNLKVVDYRGADDVIQNFKTDKVVTLYLRILQDEQKTISFLEGKPVSEADMWFNKPNEIGEIGRKLREYKDFAVHNVEFFPKDYSYLIVIERVRSNPVAISCSRWGMEMISDFKTPVKPTTTDVKSRAHNSITLVTPSNSNVNVKSVHVRYWEFGKMENTLKHKTFSISSGQLTITGLKPKTVYRFSTSLVTDYGESPPTVSAPTATLPSTPASNLKVGSQTSSSVRVTWNQPMLTSGVTVTGYSVVLSQSGGKKVASKLTTSRAVTFDNLSPATVYDVAVVVECDASKLNTSEGYVEVDHESLPVTRQAITLPLAPARLTVNNIQLTTVDALWNHDTKIAPGSTVTNFFLSYAEYTSDGKSRKPGATDIEQRVAGNTYSHTISGLKSGKTYGIKIKIATSRGTSAYSSVRVFSTKFETSELDKVRQSVEATIRSAFNSDIGKKMNEISSAASSGQHQVTADIGTTTSKYNAKKNGAWPSGRYCVGKSGSCPSKFLANSGFIRGIKIESASSVAKVQFGDSQLTTSGSCSNHFCGKIELATCCHT